MVVGVVSTDLIETEKRKRKWNLLASLFTILTWFDKNRIESSVFFWKPGADIIFIF